MLGPELLTDIMLCTGVVLLIRDLPEPLLRIPSWLTREVDVGILLSERVQFVLHEILLRVEDQEDRRTFQFQVDVSLRDPIQRLPLNQVGEDGIEKEHLLQVTQLRQLVGDPRSQLPHRGVVLLSQATISEIDPLTTDQLVRDSVLDLVDALTLRPGHFHEDERAGTIDENAGLGSESDLHVGTEGTLKGEKVNQFSEGEE